MSAQQGEAGDPASRVSDQPYRQFSRRLRLVRRRRLAARGRLRLRALGRRRRQRLAVGVEEFDLGGVVQLRDLFALRLLRDEAPRLILQLLEGRKSLGALALDLDDVSAELRVDGLG